jgi:hypothetical protein
MVTTGPPASLTRGAAAGALALARMLVGGSPLGGEAMAERNRGARESI